MEILKSALLAAFPHGFTTRSGGVSRPPWDAANLGGAVGDDPAAVAENWTLLERATALSFHDSEGCPARRLEVGVVRTIGRPGRIDLKPEHARVPLDGPAKVGHVGPYMVKTSVHASMMP